MLVKLHSNLSRSSWKRSSLLPVTTKGEIANVDYPHEKYRVRCKIQGNEVLKWFPVADITSLTEEETVRKSIAKTKLTIQQIKES